MNNKGYTIIEIAVFLLLVGIAGTMLFANNNAQSNLENRKKIKIEEQKWGDALAYMQENYMYYRSTDQDNTKLYGLSSISGEIISKESDGSVILMTLKTADVGICGSDKNRSIINKFVNEIILDGSIQAVNPWGNDWCIIVGEPARNLINGMFVDTRPIAVFSSGVNSSFETDEMDIPSGWQTCGDIKAGDNDSQMICNNGVAAATKGIVETIKKMNALSHRMISFARAKSNRNINSKNINYFLKKPPDSELTCDKIDLYSLDIEDNPFTHTGDLCGTESTSNSNIQEFTEEMMKGIGIEENERIDYWGNEILFDNSSFYVRHPYNKRPGYNTPPFTARIIANPPLARNGSGDENNQYAKIVSIDF